MSVTAFNNYNRVNWKNGPSGGTPWSADNLNIMDAGIKSNNDMIKGLIGDVSELNNNSFKFDGLLINGNINKDGDLFKNPTKNIYYHLVANQKNELIGFPQNVYPYGVLITIVHRPFDKDNYDEFQFYIPHMSSENSSVYNNCIFLRTFFDGNNVWRGFKADYIINPISPSL